MFKAIINITCAVHEVLDGGSFHPDYKGEANSRTIIAGETIQDCLEQFKQLMKKNNIPVLKEVNRG